MLEEPTISTSDTESHIPGASAPVVSPVVQDTPIATASTEPDSSTNKVVSPAVQSTQAPTPAEKIESDEIEDEVFAPVAQGNKTIVPTHFNNIKRFFTSLVDKIRELCAREKASGENYVNVATTPTKRDEKKRGVPPVTVSTNEESSITPPASVPAQLSETVEPHSANEVVTTGAQPAVIARVEAEAKPPVTSLPVADIESPPAPEATAEPAVDAAEPATSEDSTPIVADATPAPLSPRPEASTAAPIAVASAPIATAAVASDLPIAAPVESTTSGTIMPLTATKKELAPALHLHELERIRLILNAFNEEKNITALTKDSTGKARWALINVQNKLQAAFETFGESLENLALTQARDLTPAEIATEKSTFMRACEVHVNDALTSGLADDLSLGAYLLNMLRELCNTVIAKVSGNSNQFFALAKSPLEQGVDAHVRRLGENHDAAGMQP